MRQPQRAALGYSLLFAGSLAATVGWMHWRQPAAAQSSIAPVEGGMSTGAHPVVASSAPDPGTASPQDPVEAAKQRVRELARRSLAARDDGEILEAMRGMTAVATPESLQALSQLMLRHQQVGVRLAAITTLRELVENQGDADGKVRKMLYAVQGPDPQTIELATETAARLDTELSAGG